MDHNSLFYYKHFWDTAAPLIYKVALEKTPEARYEVAKHFLKVDLTSNLRIDGITEVEEKIEPDSVIELGEDQYTHENSKGSATVEVKPSSETIQI